MIHVGRTHSEQEGDTMRDEAAMEIRMLPVYAGDATLIISRQSGQQHTVLIDTGKGSKEALH